MKDFKMKIPVGAQKIIDILEHNGFEAYVVGGCVRDAVLGREPKDYDICTSATPEQMKALFKSNRYQTYDTGIQHGTISVNPKDGDIYEVTTYRIDGEYKDGRHPESVAFVSDLTQDLARRDFTMNAMAYNPTKGLVDVFGGYEDLQKGQIRCVGNADARFQEDALRIMRAIRFAARYGFDIEEGTARAAHDNRHLLKNVSAERKTSEFVKFVENTNLKLLMDHREILAEVVPEIRPLFDFNQNTPWHMYDAWEHTARAVATSPKDPILRTTAFFHDIAKPSCYIEDPLGIGHFYGHPEKSAEMTEQIMRRMKFDNESIKTVTELVKWHDKDVRGGKKNIKAFLNDLGEDQLRRLIKVQLADKMSQREPWLVLKDAPDNAISDKSYQNRERIRGLLTMDDAITDVIQSQEAFSIKNLAVNGHDMMEIGLRGKDIGDALHTLLLETIEHPEYNTKEKLMELADAYYKYINGLDDPAGLEDISGR